MAATANAQTRARDDQAVHLSDARYVPASAKLFITTRRFIAAADALDRANAWRLLPLLSGTRVGAVGPLDVRRIVAGFLGLRNRSDIAVLMRCEIGIVARSWSDLGRAVWLVRVPDKGVFARWFPLSRRVSEEKAGTGRVFRTDSGMAVCVQGDVVAVRRHDASDSFFQEVTGLMTGGGGDSLAGSDAYRKLAARLPPRPVGVVYVESQERQSSDSPGSISRWPVVERAIIGIYEGQGRIDIAIRASMATPARQSKLRRVAMDRLFQLPRTTLSALVATVDLDQIYRAAATRTAGGILGRYQALLYLILNPPDAAGEVRPELGPHVILVWGQDLREGGSTPQVAVMVECHDGRAVRDWARKVADRIIHLVRTIGPAGKAAALRIHESRHLGSTIWHVPLKSYTEGARLPTMKLLSEMEPAWTVWNGWIILALRRDHIERILDAQFGLVPPLATVPDVQALRKSPGERSMLSLVQADLATGVLGEWVSSFDAGRPSLLSPVWWRHPTQPVRIRRPQLGIGMKAVQEPGVVVVALVYPGTAAAGRLRLGDRILGVDGKLLSLESPNASLRKRWNEAASERGATLRVLRDGTALDLVLPKDKAYVRGAKPREKRASSLSTADAVRELASIGRTLQFISFAVLLPDDGDYSARLSLRFAPERVPTRSTDKDTSDHD